ncbi:RNA recognition motif 2, partial [Penicillium bovifimosum]
MTQQPPAHSQDGSSTQSSLHGQLAAFTPTTASQPSNADASEQELVPAAGSDSFAAWLNRYHSRTHRPMPQEGTASPTPRVYSPDYSCSPVRIRNQWQLSPYSPIGGDGHSQTNLAPTQGATGNIQHTPPAALDYEAYEASLAPAFVSSLSPSYPTPQGVEGLADRPQEAGADKPTRGFIVSLVDANTPHGHVLEVLFTKEYYSLELLCLKYIKDKEMFALAFADIREAIDARNGLKDSHPEWRIASATAEEVAGITGASDFIGESPQGVFLLSVQVPPQRLPDPNTEDFIKGLINHFGQVEQFVMIQRSARLLKYRVQYYSLRHGTCAFTCLDGLLYHDFRFEVSPEVSPSLAPSLGQQGPMTPHQGNSGEFEFSPNMGGGKIDGNERIISLARIREGRDVRTTIMIQHIPKFLDCDQVIEVLNRTSRGAYDFLYLRMDWRTRTNFGYAFVNFVDPLDILTLYAAIAGKKWPDCQTAEDPVKISYAMVQGKDNLVTRFRNSNVMTRAPKERPKLFHTSGPLKGLEAPFPPPNDARRLRRSVTSTAQQGVYNNGSRSQTTRSSQRNRNRSNVQRTSNRATRYPAGGSLPNDIPSSSPSARTEHDPRHSRGQSLQQDFPSGSSFTRQENQTMRQVEWRTPPTPQNNPETPSLVLHGNQTMRASVGQDLPQNSPLASPLARMERGLRHSRGQSVSQNVAPASPSAAVVARSVHHSWGQHYRAQQPSSTENAFPFTWE